MSRLVMISTNHNTQDFERGFEFSLNKFFAGNIPIVMHVTCGLFSIRQTARKEFETLTRPKKRGRPKKDEQFI